MIATLTGSAYLPVKIVRIDAFLLLVFPCLCVNGLKSIGNNLKEDRLACSGGFILLAISYSGNHQDNVKGTIKAFKS